MTISVGIYNDGTLPAIVQTVDLLTPWPRALAPSDFVGESKPIKQVPLLSWVVQFRETEIREKLITHLKKIFVGQEAIVEQKIKALPEGMVNNVLANLGFGVTTLYPYSIQPRLDNAFCPSPYSMGPLWVGYYLFDLMRSEYQEDASNEGKYRYKQLSDLREIVGYTLRTILAGNNNTIEKGIHVIVAATENSEERIVIYADNSLMGQYLDNGGTLNSLASQWITKKYNPVV